MFERFTERARQVVVLAQEEARSYGTQIGTAQIVAGLLREEEGLAAGVLANLHVKLEDVRADMGDPVDKPNTGQQIPFTPQAKKAIEVALREALSLGHNYIGTEHILLAVAREQHELLEHFGANPSDVYNGVIRALTGGRNGAKPPERTQVIEALRKLRRAQAEADDAEKVVRDAQRGLALLMGVKRRDKDMGFDAEMEAERFLVEAALREDQAA